MRRLEAELANPLLHRTTREVTLTEAASRFTSAAPACSTGWTGRSEVGSLRDGPRGQLKQRPRFPVNCALAIHRLVLDGAGIGPSSGYLCGPEIAAGRMVRLFPDWTLPSVPVHAVFPSHRQHMPVVRVILDFTRENGWDGHEWQADPVAGSDRDGGEAGRK